MNTTRTLATFILTTGLLFACASAFAHDEPGTITNDSAASAESLTFDEQMKDLKGLLVREEIGSAQEEDAQWTRHPIGGMPVDLFAGTHSSSTAGTPTLDMQVHDARISRTTTKGSTGLLKTLSL